MASVEKVLRWLESGQVKFKVVRVPIASPFGMYMLIEGRSDIKSTIDFRALDAQGT